MSRARTSGVVITLTLILAAGLSPAQIVITDPSLTSRDQVIAELKRQLLETLTQEVGRLRKMAARLGVSTNVNKYAFAEADVPVWQIHVSQGDQFLYANPFNASLNDGDRNGAGYEDVARARQEPGPELTGLTETAPGAESAIVSELATLDAADSIIIAGTDQTGRLRYNGRKELVAIDALQGDALNPSPSQSATAVLDKISGAGLIRARQQQARMQFLGAMVEQLLVESKRDRDTEAASMNMQLERLRWGHVANTNVIDGSADALRGWRQP